ncbi:hypothetical protein XENORESO_002552 [Xenotaenia resolanae]|uniref:Uncharacterized protein n=1 Tax=Xenotaenia resolanae TaxID=208358 RepID=A0ABV0WIM5_9TELE
MFLIESYLRRSRSVMVQSLTSLRRWSRKARLLFLFPTSLRWTCLAFELHTTGYKTHLRKLSIGLRRLLLSSIGLLWCQLHPPGLLHEFLQLSCHDLDHFGHAIEVSPY